MKNPDMHVTQPRRLFLAIACVLLTSVAALAQLPTPTYGWNLGNTLEPPSGEGTWAPAATQALINSVANAGFNTVRIPCAWNSHANSRSFQIDPVYMARVKQVVDWCYARNLYVIINDHWDGGWFENNGFRRFDSKINAKMQSYWTQIATAFAAYDSRLLFAGANEPSIDNATETQLLVRYYQTFVDAVRATGGQNATRWLVVQGPNTNIENTYNWLNTLPTDSTPGRLMVEVHYYDPYQYTLMTSDASWGNMFYFWGTGYRSLALTTRNPNWGEEDWLLQQIQLMSTKFTSRGIPVILGEFGAVRRPGQSELTGVELTRHLASRTYFNKKIVDLCNQYGLKPIYWDDGATSNNTFGLFDRNSATLVDVDSARALTGGSAVPPPAGGY